jgi:hypothetical protein
MLINDRVVRQVDDFSTPTACWIPKLPPPVHGASKEGWLPIVSVQATRRTCTSLLVELDVHPRLAMLILQHSGISVSMDTYSQVTAASTRKALAARHHASYQKPKAKCCSLLLEVP